MGALKNLSMAMVYDKDIVANLTEAVEQIPINNASLTTKLSDAMKLNLDMDNNINIKATQAQDTGVEGKEKGRL